MAKTYKETDKKTFAALEKVLAPLTVAGRTASASFLVWFLQTIYRLEQVEAEDAVCDKKFDKGVDAIFVADGDEEIVLFQAKRAQKIPATLGDTDLKEFVGALAQFRTPASVAALASTTPNTELKRLLADGKVADKIGNGYKLRPVFVANIAANSDAQEYIGHAAAAGDRIDLWDLDRIKPILDQVTQHQWFVNETANLKVDPAKLYSLGDNSNPDLVMAAISAKELIKLAGISNTTIFAQNVRLGLRKTRVNTELIKSINDQSEHRHFLAYHNGLTIVARDIVLSKGNISITDYSVANGCQSLQSLFNNLSVLTNSLVLPVRLVKVGEDRSLAASIAYKTNNQNPISLRDLSGNDSTQILIKSEFDRLYGFDSTYMIKQGAAPSSNELTNEYAGQLLLSLYAGMPWSAHQKYKLFGELQAKIFKYGIDASHIRFAQIAMDICDSALLKCQMERVRQYGLTRFLVLYLFGELLRRDKEGLQLLDEPSPYLRTKQVDPGRDELETQLKDEIAKLASYIVTELNYYMEDRGKDAYDYKSGFKSEKSVKTIRSEVLKAYEKDRYRDKVDPFQLPMESKAAPPASKKVSKVKK
jgi:hypothetical protein